MGILISLHATAHVNSVLIVLYYLNNEYAEIKSFNQW